MSYTEQILSNDFLWVALMEGISTRRRKKGGANFINICCTMCVERGETPDTKYRCGIKRESYIGVHCFNCGLRAKHRAGEPLSTNMKKFLLSLGLDEMAVKRLAYRAHTIAAMVEKSPEAQALVDIDISMKFPAKLLPPKSASFETWANQGCLDPDFIATAEYLFSRGAELSRSTTFYWSPETTDDINKRLIIPFYHQGEIVGWTGRAIDPSIEPKYHSQVAKDYLFNNSVLYDRNRSYVILIEGVLDALAIDGVGTLGAKLNDRQCAWVESFGKDIIVVADRDASGQRLIDIALKRGWQVAFPALTSNHASRNWWEPNCKDVAEAVDRYGRLYVLTSILKTATGDNMEINLKRKILA